MGRQLGSVVERERVLAALDARTRELERSNRELERFAYVASHDLQEPLRKIVGFSELLGERYGDELDDDGQRVPRLRGGRGTTDAAADQGPAGLLACRTGHAGTIEPVDLEAVVAQVPRHAASAELEEAGAEVTVARCPRSAATPASSASVLTNLLGNAVKYGSRRAAIAIDGTWSRTAAHVELTVTDDGIGIEPQYAEQIFEVFRRLHGPSRVPRDRDRAGHHAAVRAGPRRPDLGHRQRPRGAVFHVTAARPATEEAAMTARPIEILLIDDDPVDVRLTTEQLATASCATGSPGPRTASRRWPICATRATTPTCRHPT